MIKFITMAAYFIGLYFVVFWMLVYLQKGVIDKKKVLRRYPFLTICIPGYNEEKNIEQTIRSVANLDYPKEKIEIIVINDGSKDNTAKVVQKTIASLKDSNIILITQTNQGKGAAMNNALARAKGEFFISMDADSSVDSNALQTLLPEFTSANVASVLPMIKVLTPSTWIRKVQHCEYLLNFFYKRLMGHLNCIHVTPGPFAVYRTHILRKVGGFDTENLVEDFEMAVRLQKNHYVIKQVLTTVVYTKAPATFKQFYKQRNRWFKGAWINMFHYRHMLFNRKYGDLGIMQLPLVFASGVISLSLFLITIIWHTLKPMIDRIIDYSYINYDVMPLLIKGIREFSPLNYNYPIMFFGILIFWLVVITLLLSFRYTGESARKNKKELLYFLCTYSWIMGIVWIGVMFDLIRGKIQKW